MRIEDTIHIDIIYFYNYILQGVFKRLEDKVIKEEELEEVIKTVVNEEIEKNFILYNDKLYVTILRTLYHGAYFEYTVDFEKLKEKDITEILKILAMDYTKQYFSRIIEEIKETYLKKVVK